jgi:hypothetical protein
MKIRFDFDEDYPASEMLDDFFVLLLKREIKDSRLTLKNAPYLHDDDIELYLNNIKACKSLLKYYKG